LILISFIDFLIIILSLFLLFLVIVIPTAISIVILIVIFIVILLSLAFYLLYYVIQFILFHLRHLFHLISFIYSQLSYSIKLHFIFISMKSCYHCHLFSLSFPCSCSFHVPFDVYFDFSLVLLHFDLYLFILIVLF